jgi:hypothetical protein
LAALSRATAESLQTGATFPSPADARVQVAGLGPIEPGARSLLVQPGTRLDVPDGGTFERAAVLVLACDPTQPGDASCTIGGAYPAPGAQIRVAGPGPALAFDVEELFPAAAAQPLAVTVRLWGGPELMLVTAGDRDRLLDDRAAVVTAVGSRQPGALDVHLQVGADRAHDGWRYRGRLLKAGSPFPLTTDRYTVNGTVVAITTAGASDTR